MIIEIDITNLTVNVNGENVGNTTTNKMHECRDYAREHIDVKGGSTFYTILDGKIASMHDVSDKTAGRMARYLMGV